MAFEIAAEMRQIGKTADFRGLSDGKCLICQKIFRLVEPYFNQIAVRGAAKKLFIIRIKLAFFHIGHLAKLFCRPVFLIMAQHLKAQLLEFLIQSGRSSAAFLYSRIPRDAVIII